MIEALFSIICISYFFHTAAALWAVSLLLTPFCTLVDKNRRLLHYMASAWGYHFVQLNPAWRVRFEGLENLDKNRNYVAVANHQSTADIFMLSGLHFPFKWVSKESIFKIPFFGWNMHSTQYIRLKRGDLQSIKGMMKECRHWLARKESIMMFPEGTRSEDGNLLPFRDGSFKLAYESGTPILPIVIVGTREIFPKHSLKIAPRGYVSIRILPAVDPLLFSGVPALKKHVHCMMQNTLVEMRTAHPITLQKELVHSV